MKNIKHKALTILLVTMLLFLARSKSMDEEILDGGCVNCTIMVNGNLYSHQDSHKSGEIDFARSGITTSTVNGNKSPYKNNQSNFGTGYEHYIYDNEIICLKYSD